MLNASVGAGVRAEPPLHYGSGSTMQLFAGLAPQY
jgi:hypothetical protein